MFHLDWNNLRTARLLLGGAVALLTACLAQAFSLAPPWCSGADAQHTAVSANHQWILTKDTVQPSLMLYDQGLKPVRHFKLTAANSTTNGSVLRIMDAAPRRSFVVVLRDLPEIWEISYNPNAEPIFDGLVHDYRMGEGIPRPGFLGLRRTLLRSPLTDPYFTDDFSTVIGLERFTDGNGATARVVNLNVRREIATDKLAVFPDQGTPFTVSADGRTWRATRNLAPTPESDPLLQRYCAP